MRQLHGSFAGVLAIVLLAAPSPEALADVTVSRVIRTGGAGASEIHEIDYFKGTLKRTDSKMKLTGKVFGMLLRPKDLSTVYREDKELIWEINRTKKTYTSRPISISVGDREVAKGQREEAWESGDPGNERRQGEVRVVRNEFEIKETGEEKTINGFDCRRYVLTWFVETENVETKERKRSMMTGDFWNARADGKIKQLMDAENSFNRAYLEKLGLNVPPGDLRRFGLNMLGGVMGISGLHLKEGMAKMEGYPILSSIKWEAEGEREEQTEEEEEISAQPSNGVKGYLGGLIRKKVEGGEKKKSVKEENFQTIFESRTEIKKIETSTLPGSHFEVPKEYKWEKDTL